MSYCIYKKSSYYFILFCNISFNSTISFISSLALLSFFTCFFSSSMCFILSLLRGWFSNLFILFHISTSFSYSSFLFILGITIPPITSLFTAILRNLACVITLCENELTIPLLTLYPPSKTLTTLPSQYLFATFCISSVIYAKSYSCSSIEPSLIVSSS